MPTCNIVGTLCGSDGQPIGGTIQVQAASYFSDDTTTPDLVILPTTRTYTIANTGVVNISLPRTESQQVAYTFKITPTSGSFLEFQAVIPDVATVELSSLIPTQFSTDRAATGALRIAKEMLTNTAVQPYIISGLGLPKSATPPPAPISNDVIWIDSNTGIMHTWSPGLLGWLSEPFSTVVGGRIFTDNNLMGAPLDLLTTEGSIVLSRVLLRYEVVASPHDGSNRWTMQPVYWTAGTLTVTDATASTASNSGGYVVGTIRNVTFTPNTLLSVTTIQSVGLELVRTGFPGSLNASCRFEFRSLRMPS